VILCTSAKAEWEQTAKLGDVIFYHDKSTIKKENTSVRMWTLVNYHEPQDDSFGVFLSAKALNIYDCAHEKWAGVSVYYYAGVNGTGKLIHSDLVQPADLLWDPIVPDTMSAKNWLLACGRNH
jgi:hypothetical protein